MDKRKLNKVFKELKEKALLDYAITNTDEYGDCMSCTNAALVDAFGMESKGIFVKHWLKGMNKGRAYKDLEYVYIAHDITEEQATTLVEVFENNGYEIEPRQYDPRKCFKIKETEVRDVQV